MNSQFVVDTSILIQAYVKEEHSEDVLALLLQLEGPDTLTLHAPEFCLLECTNVIWKHVRLHGMPVEQAREAIRHLVQLPLTIQPSIEHLPAALDIGLERGLAIYDSLHLALAGALSAPLLTADARQAQVAQEQDIRVQLL